MVDAGGLNPPGAKALYRFESDPGHTNFSRTVQESAEISARFLPSGMARWRGGKHEIDNRSITFAD